MTQMTECGFCRETYEVEDQTHTSDVQAPPLNQCATCARNAARGSGDREYPLFDGDHVGSDCREQPDWLPDDRVELVDWQPSDRVWLVTHA